MAITRDFELIIPSEAVLITNTELLPLYKGYLNAVGIVDPSLYDHYQIRIAIMPRSGSRHSSFFDLFRPRNRRQKRFSLASADSLFIALEVAHDGIVLRETYPPTTYEDGQMEFLFTGVAGLGAEISVSGAKATAELQASFRKQFRKRSLAIVAQRTNGIALWEFRRPWIVQNNQPELHITCSVNKDLSDIHRYIKCQRRVTQDGRAILAPRDPKNIRLPRPSF